ncbi:excalibur calcium-binding domain-containing protein [Escherichia coli]|uniref:excalibur calcium-binding domain-containing protein n=1 Tax=Escherichia coli TaxID=562 RepID=UPI0034D97C88
MDLSCAQLAGGHAVYRADWDAFGLVGADCGVEKPSPPVRTSPRDRLAASNRPVVQSTTSGWSYRNCTDARRAGAAPLRRGTPGYGVHMDGDGDGVACEPYSR